MFGNIFSGSIRCPSCGTVGSSVKQKDKRSRELKKLEAEFDSMSQFNNGFEAEYLCSYCSEKYTKSLAKEWHILAKNVGDLRAIKEYKKIKGKFSRQK